MDRNRKLISIPSWLRLFIPLIKYVFYTILWISVLVFITYLLP